MQEIPRSQVLQVVKSENTWWHPPHEIILEYKSLKEREYIRWFFPLVESNSPRRAVVLMGPRRVGKTVLTHHAIQRLVVSGVSPEKIFYISVDNPVYSGLGLRQLIELFAEATNVPNLAEGSYVFFDEIQYLRDWERHLKVLVDSYRQTKFVVSGSAAAALQLKSTESGAGRFTDFRLPPLTFYEYMLLKDYPLSIEDEKLGRAPAIEILNREFLNYINFGGYPEVIFSKDIQDDLGRWVKADIVDKVLLRDLPQLYGIQDIQELYKLFTSLAYNTAQEVSLQELSQNSGVGKNTIKKYIEYLEAAFLIRVLHRVDQKAKAFKRANFFKVYLATPSMWSALFSPISDGHDMIGSLVETAVFVQFSQVASRPLHYARWQKGEVDVVSLGPDQKPTLALEVKWTDRYFSSPKKLKSLRSFVRNTGVKQICCTTKTKSGRREGILFGPAAVFSLQAGAHLFGPGASNTP